MIKNKIKEIVGVISSLDDELSMLIDELTPDNLKSDKFNPHHWAKKIYLDFAKKIQQFLSNNFHIIESMNVISVS